MARLTPTMTHMLEGINGPEALVVVILLDWGVKEDHTGLTLVIKSTKSLTTKKTKFLSMSKKLPGK